MNVRFSRSATSIFGSAFVQGYLFSMPVDFDEIDVLLGKRRGVD
jgi:EAL domain-containing protein (putative c-di-GMP-specific phosphodiesterase class I)